jgi:class I fructose-bisphosphate aldolase
MAITNNVKYILNLYNNDSPKVKSNILRLLSHGGLAGSGKVSILTANCNLDKSPDISFGDNYPSYDPHYHFRLAIEGNFSAISAPIGFIEAGVDEFIGEIPYILHLKLSSGEAHEDYSYLIKHALSLGCIGVEIAISAEYKEYIKLFRKLEYLIQLVKSEGMFAIVSPKVSDEDSAEEASLDYLAYLGNSICLMGAHILNMPYPTNKVMNSDVKSIYSYNGLELGRLSDRLKHIIKSSFDGRKIVMFSKDSFSKYDELFENVGALHQAGAGGSIFAEDLYRRPKQEALELISDLNQILLGATDKEQ